MTSFVPITSEKFAFEPAELHFVVVLWFLYNQSAYTLNESSTVPTNEGEPVLSGSKILPTIMFPGFSYVSVMYSVRVAAVIFAPAGRELMLK